MLHSCTTGGAVLCKYHLKGYQDEKKRDLMVSFGLWGMGGKTLLKKTFPVLNDFADKLCILKENNCKTM